MNNIYIDLITKYQNSNLFKKYLIKRYKPKIFPMDKNNNEIMLSMKQYLNIIETNKNNVDKIFWEISVIGNLDNNIQDKLSFRVYKIVNDLKSSAIYNNESDEIFVIFEQYNNFFISNNEIIQEVLLLEKGISEYDYTMNTDALINYLRIYKEHKQLLFK